ncbi:uncharacterized protein LOC125012016 [Mugil cephalus]|uniref:uncharacterized protein LOC125012016 n=1 Tax=Mugil cephalus TaxID=48193 RepID=UPI001FB621C8|nr:uncharacterized protein LOC125012016 [Mugil cephalus]
MLLCSLKRAPPSVELWPRVLTVPVGARVVLECQVTGQPLPSISWMKRGASKQTGGKITLGLRNASLYIQSTRSYDEGVYVCEASNVVGRSSSTALLRVAVSPVIVTFSGHVTCRPGGSVVLPCRAVGIEPITYTWTRAGAETPISPTPHRHTDGEFERVYFAATNTNTRRKLTLIVARVEDGALHISRVHSSDAGEYFCTAENRIGRHQRRTILSITDEEHLDVRGKQTRQILSANTNAGGKPPVSQSSIFAAEQHFKTTHHPHVQAQHKETTRSSSNSGTTSPPFSRKSMAALKLQLQLNQPTATPHRPSATQMQPLILPPPPHPNFQSTHTQWPVTPHPSFTRGILGATLRYLPSEPRLILTSPQTQVRDEPSPDVQTQPPPELPAGGPFDFLKFDSHVPTQNPAAQTETSYSEAESLQSHQPVTEGSFLQQTHPQQSFNLSFLPKFHLELSSIPPSTQPPPPLVTKLQVLGQMSTTTAAKVSNFTELPQTKHPTELLSSTIHSNRSTLDVEDRANRSDQLNATQQDPPVQSVKSGNDTVDGAKMRTSQSPTTSSDLRVTQRSPSWLPVLEKHDIPVVVGVGVSLAFIFITVTFYSVVQKNEPAPTSRAGKKTPPRVKCQPAHFYTQIK